jgi:hypothetical protein
MGPRGFHSNPVDEYGGRPSLEKSAGSHSESLWLSEKELEEGSF